MTQSPLCKNCGFPLCHYRTKSCILYMGETQAICGSCGLAQEAKTTFDFSSPFMTHIEHQMAERLYSIATALGDKCNYNIVKKNLIEEFGENSFNRFQTTAQRDLASLEELRRIKGKPLNRLKSNPFADREILSQSMKMRFRPTTGNTPTTNNGQNMFYNTTNNNNNNNNNQGILSTSISTPISRKLSGAYNLQQQHGVKDRALSSFSSPNITSSVKQIVKNDSGRVVYASLPAMVNLIATNLEEKEREEYEQTILLTYKQYTTLSIIISEIVNQLDIAVTSEYYNKKEHLTSFFKLLLKEYVRKENKRHSDLTSKLQEIESLLLFRMDNANGSEESLFWDQLIQFFMNLQKPDESNNIFSDKYNNNGNDRKSNSSVRDIGTIRKNNSGKTTQQQTKNNNNNNNNNANQNKSEIQSSKKKKKKKRNDNSKIFSDGRRVIISIDKLDKQIESMFPSRLIDIMLQQEDTADGDTDDGNGDRDKSKNEANINNTNKGHRTSKSTSSLIPSLLKRAISTPTEKSKQSGKQTLTSSPFVSPPLKQRSSSLDSHRMDMKYLDLARTPSLTIASQLTLMTGACFKRITAEEMVDKERSKTESYKTILALYHMLAKYVQDEFLKEDLDLTERVDIFIKFIKIAHKCAELGNFFCCLCIVSCFNRKLFPDQLWERIPSKAKLAYENLNKTFVVSGREGYDAALRAFRKKFYIPDFRPVLHHLSQKLDRLPSINADNQMINLGKFVSIYRLLNEFLSNQMLEVKLNANFDIQERIVRTFSRVAQTNDTIFDMKRFTNLKESVRNLVMCEQLDQLGFG